MPTGKRAKRAKAKPVAAENLKTQPQLKAGENSMEEQGQGVTEQLLHMLLDERQRRDVAEERRERQFNEQMLEMRDWMERSQAR